MVKVGSMLVHNTGDTLKLINPDNYPGDEVKIVDRDGLYTTTPKEMIFSNGVQIIKVEVERNDY